MLSTTTAPTSAAPPPRTAAGGTMEDRYRSLFVVGRGGMGWVEVALERGASAFERVVALKRLLPEAARETRQKEMFLREARLAALLCHPNVVHAFAYGEIRGEPYIAMEYVEGQPLSNVLAAPVGGLRLEPELAAFVLAEVCEGLHAAHELCDVGGRALKVVHRDVSPHNVMVAYDGRIKLLDFGVAKLEATSHHTRTGEIKGKVAYMSPEQALGEPLDRRSDLYSVGAVLFECLTGQRMWGTGTDLEVMRRMALEEPPRLDQALPGAPPSLVELHRRLVARAPADRPETALEVADALRAVAGAAHASDVRTRMEALFAREAAESQALLTKALVEAAPREVEELRQSLVPETAPVIVRAQPRRGSVTSWTFGGIGVGVVVAVATMLATSARRPATTVTAPAAAKPSAAAVAAVAPAPSVVAVAPAPVLTATPPAEAAPVIPPLPVHAASAIPAMRPPRTSPSAGNQPAAGGGGAPPGRGTGGNKLPDVDPTPF